MWWFAVGIFVILWKSIFMEINWIIIGTVFIGVIALVVFIVRRNNKDQKDYEIYLDKNDPAIKDEQMDLEDLK